jgi:hypothetical protein
MIFNVSAYLNNDSSVKEMKDYNKYVSTGILLDEDMLYLLIVGEFVRKKPNKTNYLSMKKIKFGLEDFNCTIQFLNGFKSNLYLYITPHIFTKFVHLLWENIKDKNDYSEVIKVFSDKSKFIKEKSLEKDYFFREDNFKDMKWDISNSSLILTSREHKHKTIFTCRDKTDSLCDSCGCLVINYKNVRSAYITNYYR